MKSRLFEILGGVLFAFVDGDDPEWFALARECNLYNRPELMRNAYPEVHYSEWAWIGSHYDIVMDNNCSLDEFEDKG